MNARAGAASAEGRLLHCHRADLVETAGCACTTRSSSLPRPPEGPPTPKTNDLAWRNYFCLAAHSSTVADRGVRNVIMPTTPQRGREKPGTHAMHASCQNSKHSQLPRQHTGARLRQNGCERPSVIELIRLPAPSCRRRALLKAPGGPGIEGSFSMWRSTPVLH